MKRAYVRPAPKRKVVLRSTQCDACGCFFVGVAADCDCREVREAIADRHADAQPMPWSICWDGEDALDGGAS